MQSTDAQSDTVEATQVDPVSLSLFARRVAAVCDEMGAVLKRSAFSPNIRDRLDYSCAVFDAQGELVEQAAAIPVHLGSMAYAMRDTVQATDWAKGFQVILNNPYRGGTHLPDVTVIAPVYIDGHNAPVAFVANRAHHADIGASAPGSMPVSAHIDEEGVLISPTTVRETDLAELAPILARLGNPELARGDFAAQFSANQVGARRIGELIAGNAGRWQAHCVALAEYAEHLAVDTIRSIPNGNYQFEDAMDDDGFGSGPIPIKVGIDISDDCMSVDFSGSGAAVRGNLNCPRSVAAAGVHYVLRCLMPESTPRSAGAMRPVKLNVNPGSLLDARYPSAVAAGNVETSMRVVDAVCGALARAIPRRMAAAGQGTMNNIAFGSRQSGMAWDFYETLAGGIGACAAHGGADATHSHMTNTLNTPVEVIEHSVPVRIQRYAVRKDSGGTGQQRGGDGLIREYRFLRDAEISVISERRAIAPWGLSADDGACGENRFNGESVGGKSSLKAKAGDTLSIATPGGGGWSDPDLTVS